MQPQGLDTSFNNGDVKGDSKSIPDKGTGTGLNGDSYGASIERDATNSTGSIKGSTKSDAPFDNMPRKPN